MTEEMPIEEDSVSQESKPNWRRELESRAKAGDEAVAKLAQLERELSFRNAGVDPQSKQGQYFIRGYDGEMTVDAIRAEAAELGLTGESNTPAVQAPPVDYGAEQRIAMAADDAGPVSSPELNELISRTSTPEELQMLMESNGYTWNAAV
jgi:peptidoglycan hydrolase-like protein with peptidoglycan-binding domain